MGRKYLPSIFTQKYVHSPTKITALLLRITPWAPLFLLMWFIARYGVNVAYMDEWYFPARLYLLKHRSLSLFLQSIWLQNNEHRILFPNLVWTAFAFTTKWNHKLEMFFDALLFFVAFLALYRLAGLQRIGTSHSGKEFHFAMFLTGLMLFSLAQWENWLWGFGLPFILTQACFSLVLLTLSLDTLSAKLRFGVAAGFCFIASYSAAQGLCSWLAAIPCVVTAFRERWHKAAGFWLLLFATTTTAYSYRFHRERTPGIGDLFFSLHHPFRAVEFFLALLGAPLAQGYPFPAIGIAPVIGAAITAILLLCLYKLKRSFRLAVPWLSLALYEIGFALLATLGRSEDGLEISQTSRYTTMTVFAIIAAIQLFRLMCLQNSRLNSIGLVAGFILIAATVTTSTAAIDQARKVHDERLQAKSLLKILGYVDPATDNSPQGSLFPLFPVEGYTGSIRDSNRILIELGYQPNATSLKFIENPLVSPGSLDSIGPVSSLVAIGKTDFIVASGWAAFPDARRAPELILISYGNQKRFIASGLIGTVERADIATLLGSPRYLRCGWKVRVPAEFLPEREGMIKAWVYDAHTEQFIKLSDYRGPKRVQVQP